jgi:hypothetical protein
MYYTQKGKSKWNNTYHFRLALHSNDKSIFILGWFNTNDIFVDQSVVLVAMPVCQVKWFLQTTQIPLTLLIIQIFH